MSMKPHWPADNEPALKAYFGSPGESQLVSLDLPYPMRIAWSRTDIITRTRCHRKVAESLHSILTDILRHYGSLTAVQAARMDLFGGIYNFRKMRNGNSWSRHSWGIAIDLDPDQNGLNTAWPSLATMPRDVISIFDRQGWKSGGLAWGRDAMHFQATL